MLLGARTSRPPCARSAKELVDRFAEDARLQRNANGTSALPALRRALFQIDSLLKLGELTMLVGLVAN